ncbi:YhcN/YlaJ family sporulation lipoprotein [Paraliobacillus salinarum]|uniref:YhcN/YlaJ family sporulation lipoprotein n=1 Tax=Paraliobacillus salinarum TaxID=1158996 RepID=UPI0015F64050|nr:YhcN/YlaJ family sporulation lipoprotein [Paraliobacillus salinarum]
MKYKLLTFFSALLLLTSLFGCNQNNESTNQLDNVEKINYQQTTNSDVTYYIRKKFDSVSDVKAIVYDKELIVAIKATTFQQINEQSIEKKVKKSLEEQFNFKEINVSSDQKIFIEINKIHQSPENLEKKFNHIKKLLKDNA